VGGGDLLADQRGQGRQKAEGRRETRFPQEDQHVGGGLRGGGHGT
jgi:hypothetical protein